MMHDPDLCQAGIHEMQDIRTNMIRTTDAWSQVLVGVAFERAISKRSQLGGDS